MQSGSAPSREPQSIFQDSVGTMDKNNAGNEMAQDALAERNKGLKFNIPFLHSNKKEVDSFEPPRDSASQIIVNAQEPQIVLEMISGHTAAWCIIMTYVMFIIGISLDTYLAFQNSNNNGANVVSGFSECPGTDEPGMSLLYRATDDWGCVLSEQRMWHGVFPNVYDVLHVNLDYTITNFTVSSLLAMKSEDDNMGNLQGEELGIDVKVELWACFESGGCGPTFQGTEPNSAGYNGYNSWQFVYGDTSGVPVVTADGDSIMYNRENDGKDAIMQLVCIFQNQEALPTNAPIKSYYAQITAVNDKSFAILKNTAYSDESFTLQWLHRQAGAYNTFCTIFTMVLFVATLSSVIAYVFCVTKWRVWRGKKWLPEQSWFLVYTLSVLLYQNPIYLIQNLSFVPTAGEALSAYVCSYLGQVLLLATWLMYADGINQYTKTWKQFYLPKFGYGIIMFTSICVVLGYQFPSYSLDSNRSPVLSTHNWPQSDLDGVVAGSVMFVTMLVLWAFIWFFHLLKTYRKLNLLPYLSTRYQQLLFRFFFLQATLVAVYYISQYSIAVYFVGHSTYYGYTADTLADSINTVIRQQTSLFGKTLFITAYVFILGFLLLPPQVLSSETGSILTAFALDEKEHAELVLKRQQFIQKFSGKMAKLVRLAQRGTAVFCLSTALTLLEVSNASYGDHELEDKRDNDVFMTNLLAEYGYTFIESVTDDEYDSQLIVARHVESQRLVFAFRGTQSKKNMSDNLQYKKKYINFKKMPLPKLDLIDSLDPIGASYDERYTGADYIEPTNRSSFGLGFLGKIFSDKDEVDSATNNNRDIIDEQGQSKMSARVASTKFTDNVSTFIEKSSNLILDGVIGVTDFVTEGVETTAAYTIGINKIVGENVNYGVHGGFLSIYNSLRVALHRIYRREMLKQLSPVQITGHSMGGALATFAAFDLQDNSVPRVRAYYRALQPSEGLVAWDRKMEMSTVTFGSPRVGDANFMKLFNKMVPDSFRVVVDGDIVTTVPRTSMGFKHVGTQVLIDQGAGNIIVDPSFVERWLRMRKTSDLSTKENAHLVNSYRSSILAVVHGIKRVLQLQKSNHGSDDFLKNIISKSSMPSARYIDTGSFSDDSISPRSPQDGVKNSGSTKNPMLLESGLGRMEMELRGSSIGSSGRPSTALRRQSSHGSIRGSMEFVGHIEIGSFDGNSVNEAVEEEEGTHSGPTVTAAVGDDRLPATIQDEL